LSEVWAFLQIIQFFSKLIWRVITNKIILGLILFLIFISKPTIITGALLLFYIGTFWIKIQNKNQIKSDVTSVHIENHNHNTLQIDQNEQTERKYK
jgi:uncharacterized membrane protein